MGMLNKSVAQMRQNDVVRVYINHPATYVLPEQSAELFLIRSFFLPSFF